MSTGPTDGNLGSQEIEQLEDRLDAALLKLARVEQANDEVIPFALVQVLSDGGVPTRVWREHRGLSREELAQAAGVPVELVVQVEFREGRRATAVDARPCKRIECRFGRFGAVDDGW